MILESPTLCVDMMLEVTNYGEGPKFVSNLCALHINYFKMQVNGSFSEWTGMSQVVLVHQASF